MRSPVFVPLLVALLLVVSPTTAQQTSPAQRDPLLLARRYLDSTADHAHLAEPSPDHQVGDIASFHVAGADAAPQQIDAQLIAEVPEAIALWLQSGLVFDLFDVEPFLTNLAASITHLRQPTTYGAPDHLRALTTDGGRFIDPTGQIVLPTVGADNRLHILFAADLNGPRAAYYNPIDLLPPALAPGGVSNARTIIYVDLASLPVADPQVEARYFNAIVGEVFRLLWDQRVPGQAVWLGEALAPHVRIEIGDAVLTPPVVEPYLTDPNVPLLLPRSRGNAAITGGQQLFLQYVRQRYGDAVFWQAVATGGDGLAPFDHAFAAANLTDPLTGADVRAVDAFADFTLAHLLNRSLGDGRYQHLTPAVPPNRTVRFPVIDLGTGIERANQGVHQFGAAYVGVRPAAAGVVEVVFDGQPTVPLLPLDISPENHFYWSGGGRDRDHTLTYSLDLSGVATAALTFDAWYDLTAGVDYAYVAVSADDGVTWTPLPATGMTRANPLGAAYGVGFTGSIANPDWQPQQVDLSAYTGQSLQLRFEYVSLPYGVGQGVAIDNIAIPALEWVDDAEQPSDAVEMIGWQRTTNTVPARYIVEAVVTRANSPPRRVWSLLPPGSDTVSGVWPVDLGADELLVLAISAVSTETTQPAVFDLRVTP